MYKINLASKVGQCKKLLSPWLGPYLVDDNSFHVLGPIYSSVSIPTTPGFPLPSRYVLYFQCG